MENIKDKNYDFIDMGEGNLFHIILTEHSPYEGVEYQYGKVKLVEDNDQLRLTFEYEVFDNPNSYNTESKGFVDYIGVILKDNLEKVLLDKGN